MSEKKIHNKKIIKQEDDEMNEFINKNIGIEMDDNQLDEKMEEHLINKEKERYCQCCDIQFGLKTDYQRHIKTNKHIKKSLALDESTCPYCKYKTDDKSNMNKHLNNVHKYMVKEIKEKVKRVKSDKIPDKVLKLWFQLLTEEKTLLMVLGGTKTRYKHHLNRNYKPDEEVMIQIKLKYKQKLCDYNNTLEKKKDLISQYPQILDIKPPSVNIDSDDDSDCETVKNVKINDAGLKAIKELEKMKEDKRNDIKKRIEENRHLYIDSKGTDKSYISKIEELEEELRNI